MYKDYPTFTKPQGNKVKIWRYMDFTKFVSLLDKQQLFFARSDKLGDPFEGSYPEENIQQRWLPYSKLLEVINNPQRKLSQVRMQDSKIIKMIKHCMYVNSWHESQYESAAMWKLYLKSNEGIAIQSTFGRLKDCFRANTPNVFIGEVHYRDYSVEKIPKKDVFAPFLHKRKSFEHEKELRAIVLEVPQDKEGKFDISKPPSINGIDVRVDLEGLIANIYVAPGNPKWFVELVKSVTKKYGLNKPVKQSALDAKPLY